MFILPAIVNMGGAVVHGATAMAAGAEGAAAAGAGGGGEDHSDTAIVRSLVVMLIAAALVAMVLRRVKLATIPCYLITGAIIGPTALGLVSSPESVQAITSLAVVMLMFTIGLHLNPSELRGGGMVRTLTVGVVSTLAVVGVFWPLSATATGSVQSGLAISMAIAMSSTAVAMRLLSDYRETQRALGRLVVGVSIMQDLLSLAALASMPLLAAWAGVKGSGDSSAHAAFLLPQNWSTVLKAVGGLVGITLFILAGRAILPRLVFEASRGASSEIALVFSAGAALLAAVVAAGLGFSPELGAFTAGFLLSSTPAKHQLAGQLSPMRDLFMAIFFTAVGMKLEFAAVRDGWMLIFIGVVGVLVLKTFIIAATAWALGATSTLAARAGLLLGQAGEFTIVVLAAASASGLVDGEANSRLIAIVVLTLLMVPPLYKSLARFDPVVARIKPAGWTRSNAFAEPVHTPPPSAPGRKRPSALSLPEPTGNGTAPETGVKAAPTRHAAPKHVIIAGFGVVGRSLADRLDLIDIPFVVVDMNQSTINTQIKLGRRAIYGDISNAEVLESAGIAHADAVMLTIPDDEATLRACKVVREHRADVYIAARNSFLSKAMQAMQLGADLVVVEEVATAEAMAKQVMDALVRRAAAAGAQSAKVQSESPAKE
ncbi:MAG: cation:proton antiporter [Phycisphaerales bacterium]|nr:cation:proton antiporter [Phycisphaerales bacterium]